MTSDTPTIFGLPAISVPQPKGEPALYVIRDEPLPAAVGWLAGKWSITSADGKTYSVTESKGGHWHCGCKSMEFAKRSCKRVLSTGQLVCKHIGAIVDRKYPPPPAPVSETCGYCCGRGTVPSRSHDSEGREVEPHAVCCEYCGGFGECIEGSKLLAARGV